MAIRLPKQRFRSTTRLEIQDKLRQLAYQEGPNAKLPTVRELCDRLETSVATLDYALDELEQQRVIYRIHGRGIFVSPKLHVRHIAIVFEVGFFQDLVASPFWGSLWGLFISRAQLRAQTCHEEFSFHLVSTWNLEHPDLPEQLVDLVETGRAAGVIGIGITESTALWFMKNVPYVSFAGPSAHEVVGDAASGIELGVQALAAQGCRAIGHWNPAEPNRRFVADDPTLEHYLPSFHTVLRPTIEAAGLQYHPELCRDNANILRARSAFTRLSNQEQGFALAMEVFGDPTAPKPDGLIIADDMMTSGALAAFGRLGIRPDIDVKVATQANLNSPILFGHESALTRLMYDPSEFVDRLFDVLEQLLSGRTDLPRLTLVKARLVGPLGKGDVRVARSLIEE